MKYVDNHYLKERYKNYTDEDLHDCLREIKAFGGDPSDIRMMEMESKRRSEMHAEAK